MSSTALAIAQILGDTIRELTLASPLKGVPNGEFYARIPATLPMTLEQYNGFIEALVSAKLVSRKNHLLSWIGPLTEEQKQMKTKGKSEPRRKAGDQPRKATAGGSSSPSTSDQNAAPSDSVDSPGNENILPQGQNIALPSDKTALSSIASSTRSQEKNQMATLKYRKTDKSGSSSYSIEGVKSSVYFNKGMFAGEPPAALEISLPEGFAFTEPGAAPKVGVAKLTPEERKAQAEAHKAKLAAMTPAERAALKVAEAQKQLEKAQKAAEKASQAPA